MKILLAVDGSSYTKHMLAYLAVHDALFGAAHAYTVVHGVIALPHRAAAFVEPDVVRGCYDDDAETVFRPIKKFLKRHGIEATFVHKIGNPADIIAKLAEKEKFDLLVMGSHGRGFLGSLVLGSVVTKVLAQCSTPVLLIR
ncbi:MAG: universal stress protein [Methylibium sp.]|nr:universal stress protein [Methylibium sp.]